MTVLPLSAFEADTTTESIATHFLAAAYSHITRHPNPGNWLVPFLDLVSSDWFPRADQLKLFDALIELTPTSGGHAVITDATITRTIEQRHGRSDWIDPYILSFDSIPVESDLQVWSRQVLPIWRRHRIHGRVLSLIADADTYIRLSPSADRWQKASSHLSAALETMAGIDREPESDLVAAYLAQQLGPVRTEAWISTGLHGLDRTLDGGFGAPGSNTGGRLIVLAARPSMGKSQFALQLVHNVLLQQAGVWMASLEMGPQQVSNRLLACLDYHQCRLTGGDPVPSHALRRQRFTEDQRKRLQGLQQILPELTGRLILSPGLQITPEAVVTQLRFAKRRQPGLALAVIDHLGLLELRGDNRNNSIGEATRMLLLAAQEIGIDILLLCQLSRAVEQRSDKMPLLSDLRESGNIEQDADVVTFLLRPGYYDPEADPFELHYAVAKNREGAVGRYQAATYAEHCAVIDAPRSVA